MYWTTSSGRIELNLTKREADWCSHSGPCDMDVLEVSKHPKVASQLRKIDAELLRQELKEYGAWEDHELQDHDLNLQRLVWLAAGDINDECRS